ncbi:hypothetical protein [Bradyrhizobium sp. AUGA SZCCT0182]|uniref:hypothetical protein n=1 Tax=Bradyrhizobium sp. AUGA SZCCT0182 TaxID=2807667 RepID=UPI001BA71F85|nr:hypothetical protein [Bradyrhizobium sp. AUGA SZCCT0182]MBR1236630.1 hypothetical protein [Bradyrhizobium sp. AUGA SZCCT0182]
MNLAIKRLEPVKLRSVGLDERWLQQRIIDDPEILGLGQLEIASREHRQPYGGRIDFLMRDAEGETYYAVEVMLGALDESHIIRTLEYWDLERQRRPQLEHRAVIVAEEITGRFFNVIRLLNRAVPIIAVQLTAVKLNDNDVGLLPVTVLDVLTEFGDPAAVAPEERVDRPYWETKVPAASLSVVDKIVAGLRSFGAETRLTYNRHHIALGSTGVNFAWFHPRQTSGNCQINFRVFEDRDGILLDLQNGGIDASPKRTNDVGFGISAANLPPHLSKICEVLKVSEQHSRE